MAVQGRAGEDYGFLETLAKEGAGAEALAERAFAPVSGRGMLFAGGSLCQSRERQVVFAGALLYIEEKGSYTLGSREGRSEDAEEIGVLLARRNGAKVWKKGRCRSIMEHQETGKVWLAGAGPGDAGLLTRKAEQVLESADVVVYDHLVGRDILARIRPDQKAVNVGKISGHHPIPQEEINQILVEEARQGNQVVRLKGGDPFLFWQGRRRTVKA